MQMVIRIRHGETLLHEWVGVVPTLADLPSYIHSALKHLYETAPDVSLHRVTISADRYGA